VTNKLTPSRYKEILADVIRLFKNVEHSLVTAYWKTGQYTVEIEQDGEPRAAYGDGIIHKFSEELTENLGPGFSVTSLRRMRQFYLENRKRAPVRELSWSHHVVLMPVTDAKVRKALEQKAVREGLTRDNLRVLVRHEAVRAQVAAQLRARESGLGIRKELLKVPKLGLFDTCRIKDPNETPWPDKNVLLLDHGFKGYRALMPAEARGLKAGDIVAWTGVKLVKNGRTAQDLFTYRAYLESVIDGDTLWVMLDTNIRGASRQKLRLRGIDCPEINTEEGKKAKQFVEKVLKGVPSLTVLSSKNPTFDRYEADVFFLPVRSLKASTGGTGTKGDQCSSDKEGKEVYLNNLILENGYAVKV
jgi:endonuclease YncB( thermonuclease family)